MSRHIHLLRIIAIGVAFVGLLAVDADAKTIKVPQDQPTIQLAVDNADPFDTILVSKGYYLESVNIPASKNGLTLKTKGKVTLDAAQSGNGFTVEADDVQIIGFTIWHPSQYGVDALSHADRLILKDLTILHGADYAIQAVSDDLVIEDCLIQGCEGTYLTGDRIKVSDTKFVNDGYIGVYIVGDDAKVLSCSLDNCDNYGMYIVGERALVTKCRTNNTRNEGIYVFGADAEITKNTVTNSWEEGIEHSGDNAIIKSNKLTACQLAGIYSSGANVRIEKNKIDQTYEEGIDYAGTGGVIIDNTIENVNNAYQALYAKGTGVLVAGNKISNACWDGIYVTGLNVIVRDNQVTGTGQGDEPCRAFSISGTGSAIVEDNIASNNAGDGFYIVGSDVMVRANLAKNNLEDGIQIGDTATGIQVIANTMIGNLGEGFENDAPGTVFEKNTLKNNRIDVANDGTFASFSKNVFFTGGETTPAEIDT